MLNRQYQMSDSDKPYTFNFSNLTFRQMTRWYLSKSSNTKCLKYPNGNLTCRQWLIVSRRVFPGFFIFWGNHYWWFFNEFVKWLDGICLKVLIQNVSHTLSVIWPAVKWLIVSRRVFPGFFICYIFFIYSVSFLRVSHSLMEAKSQIDRYHLIIWRLFIHTFRLKNFSEHY